MVRKLFVQVIPIELLLQSLYLKINFNMFCRCWIMSILRALSVWCMYVIPINTYNMNLKIKIKTLILNVYELENKVMIGAVFKKEVMC